jgi:hypothetical protein
LKPSRTSSSRLFDHSASNAEHSRIFLFNAEPLFSRRFGAYYASFGIPDND